MGVAPIVGSLQREEEGARDKEREETRKEGERGRGGGREGEGREEGGDRGREKEEDGGGQNEGGKSLVFRCSSHTGKHHIHTYVQWTSHSKGVA